MKNVLLLFLTLTLFSCSDDDSAPAQDNTVTVAYNNDRACANNLCGLTYKVTNNSNNTFRKITVRFNFNRTDVYNGGTYRDWESSYQAKESQNLAITLDEATQITGYEVIKNEIMQE